MAFPNAFMGRKYGIALLHVSGASTMSARSIMMMGGVCIAVASERG